MNEYMKQKRKILSKNESFEIIAIILLQISKIEYTY